MSNSSSEFPHSLTPLKRVKVTQVARDLGIADSTLYHWCKAFAQQGDQAFPGSGHQTAQEEEIRRFKRELEVVRQERDILKKVLHIYSRDAR
jgi:transposase